MCCRLTIAPLDPEVAAAILALGLFTPSSTNRWSRVISEEVTTVIATLQSESNTLRLELSPAVGQYSQHADKRIAGGVYFEIAAKYAERVDGRIKQLSNVAGCLENGVAEHILADYPEIPLLWERVCPGFREVILGSGG